MTTEVSTRQAVEKQSPAAHAVTSSVAKAYGVHLSKMLTPGKRQTIMAARSVAIFCCRVYLNLSIHECAEEFGMSANGVYQAMNRVEDWVKLRSDNRVFVGLEAGEDAARVFNGRRDEAAE